MSPTSSVAVAPDHLAANIEAVAAAIEARDSSSGVNDEKPVSVNVETIPIVIGVVIPVIIALIVLYLLHRRNVKKMRAEDAKDAEVNLDYGLAAGNKKPNRKSLFGLEKAPHKGQLSMDMNLSSPYLLNPAFQGSHTSIQSMSKGFPNDSDPYRLVAEYSSETGSIRSFNPTSRGTGSVRSGFNGNGPMSPRKSSLPGSKSISRSTTLSPSDDKVNPFATPKVPEPALQTPSQPDVRDSALPVKPIVPHIETVESANEQSIMDGVDMPMPPPRSAARNNGSPKLDVTEMSADAEIGVARGGDPMMHPHASSTHSNGLGLDLQLDSHIYPAIELPDQPFVIEEPASHPSSEFPPAIGVPQLDGHGDDSYERGRPTEPRESVYYDHIGGLDVPQQAGNRLSVGFRPLPPDEVMESEDPEYRANRIRSFYKEYFDDGRDAPPLPTQHNAEYYDEYDTGYLGEAAYYDADTNAFVMPYAQPVTRRAMTPPPAGRRGPPRNGPGPRGPPGPRPPRGFHGSASGGSLGGPPRRPRAGSAYSSPRPGSSASGRMGRGMPKKALPPPSILNTLPTPSKLRDDSFAIFNATDFAPPDTFKDHVAGRSQSPLGERRPYSPAVPVHSPLVTAFDELATLPSPHLLRKSSTFTGLDFAPPKKFKDGDTMSDAGSIRSNRSGISSAQLSALRSGAGRVSRLPGDMVFSAAAEQDQLKPQWGMRP